MFCATVVASAKMVQGPLVPPPSVPAAAIALAAPRFTVMPITWIGGNANWDASNANWNPTDEPDANDEAIFNTPNTVNMANAADTIMP